MSNIRSTYLWIRFTMNHDGCTHTHNKDDIAVCCEKLYFEGMQNNSLKDDSIKKALSTLSAQPIGEWCQGKKTIVLSLNLFEVTFVDAKTALDVVKQYIKNGYPWFYEADNRLDRILILDGLDEIKYKVYEKSQELLRELEGEKWKFDCKVIVSGRTQAVREAKENIYNYIDVEILPLYIDEDERKNI